MITEAQALEHAEKTRDIRANYRSILNAASSSSNAAYW